MKPREEGDTGLNDNKASGGPGKKEKHVTVFTLPARRTGQTRNNDKGTFGP